MTARFVDFARDPVTVARRLLGQRLVRVHRKGRLSGVIVEVEAYLGTVDRAAHSFGGRRTPRNESMYLAGGHAYVYFTYGMHFCFNVVCGAPGDPVAVLVRALAPEEGIERMRRRRGMRREEDLCSGPGRLTQALAIDRSLDAADLRRSDEIFIERRRGRGLPSAAIEVTARIGMGNAVGEWTGAPLRFCVRGNPHVSRTRPAGIATTRARPTSPAPSLSAHPSAGRTF